MTDTNANARFTHAAWGLLMMLSSAGCLASEADLSPEDLGLDAGLEEVASVQAELVGGTHTSLRPEIGRIVSGNQGCTGTLIGPTYVLTAGHCFAFPLAAASTFTIKDATGASHSYPINAGQKFGLYGNLTTQVPDGMRDDVGVLRLSQAVPSGVAAPAAIAAVLPTSGTQTIFGYGCQERATKTGGGSKQYFSFAMGNATQALCGGDSGGPVVSGAANGVGAVWGTNSTFTNDTGNDNFGSASWYKEDILSVILQWLPSPLIEASVDRPGMDYRNFASTDVGCMTECQKDLKCRAFTYVSSTGRCWLKSAVPDWRFCSNCTTQSSMAIEMNVNRSGSDYSFFDVAAGRVDLCIAACARDAACKAYTYAPPATAGGQGRCHLKNAVPAPSAFTGAISAAKRALEVDVDRPGSDKRVETIANGSATDCQQRCATDPVCRAFTWEPATNTCRIKAGAAKPVAKAGVTSGLKRGVEMNRDRPGAEYSTFEQNLSNTPQVCQAFCMLDSRCQAWSFVPAGRASTQKARCSLKDAVPAATVVQGYASGLRGAEFF